MTEPNRPGSEFGDGEPVVRDKRRIDPETGRLREPSSEALPRLDPAPRQACPVRRAPSRRVVRRT